DEEMEQPERLAWIQLEGLPMHAWSVGSVESLTKSFGRIIEVENLVADNTVPETEAAHTSYDTPLSNEDSVAVVDDTYEATVQSPMPMEKVETANSSPRLVEDVCIDITNGLLNGPCEHELEKNDISSCSPSGVRNFPGLIKKRMARATHL
ncbi:hypothetical protein Tco_0419829, partial [Tanacetum coccineum]